MLTTILTGVLALTAVIVLLVAVLMFCEKKLVKKGKVKLLINDDPAKSPEVDVGSNSRRRRSSCRPRAAERAPARCASARSSKAAATSFRAN